MAIHYDKKTGRFKDDRGRFVAKDRAMRSSIARREYEQAQRSPSQARRAPAGSSKKPIRAPVAPPPAPSKKKPPAAPAPAKRVAKPASKPPPPAKKAAKPKRRRRPASRPSAREVPPWELMDDDEAAEVREFPAADEWFPDARAWDRDYGYDDLVDEWGDYVDDDTTSGGESEDDS